MGARPLRTGWAHKEEGKRGYAHSPSPLVQGHVGTVSVCPKESFRDSFYVRDTRKALLNCNWPAETWLRFVWECKRTLNLSRLTSVAVIGRPTGCIMQIECGIINETRPTWDQETFLDLRSDLKLLQPVPVDQEGFFHAIWTFFVSVVVIPQIRNDASMAEIVTVPNDSDCRTFMSGNLSWAGTGYKVIIRVT